ncbi:helix-turn-helix domain-containing protein [Nocardioides bruguierae]|uniref:helix-turn-helix domain-containing protein n=1 Tax=Nocardioides bruguierae TaxID=2945102 RepID=UPI003556C4FE
MAAKKPAAPELIKTYRAPAPDLRTREELAEILRVDGRYVERLIAKNKITHVKIGRKCLFVMDDIKSFIDSHRVWAEPSYLLDLPEF